MRLFTVILFTVLFFTTHSLPAKGIHLLLAGDTTAKGNKNLASGVKRNCKSIERSFSYIAKICKVSFHLTKITSESHTLTSEHLDKWVTEAHIAPDDVVIFYYCGHGDRDLTAEFIWPRMIFTDKKLDSTPIIEKFVEKRAALTIVLLDCCNVPCFDYLLDELQLRSKMIELFNINKYKNESIAISRNKLFFERSGIIIACAAKPAEYAWVDPDIYKHHKRKGGGGFFTNAFLNSLFKTLRSRSPHWRSICKETKKICYKESKETNETIEEPPQTPQYAMLIGSTKKEAREYIDYVHKHCIYRTGVNSAKDLPIDKRFDEKVRELICFKKHIDGAKGCSPRSANH